jgi:hypothetical protein
MGEFARVARYLTHPLVLVGFALFLVFDGTFKLIISSGIVPTLSPQGGFEVIEQLLFYAFILVLAVIVLGSGLKYYEIHQGNAKIKELLTPIIAKYVGDQAQITRISEAERNRVKEAIREAETRIARMGLKVTASNLVLMGDVYLVAGEFDKATVCFEQAIKEDAKGTAVAEARRGLAISYQLQANDALRKGVLDHV